MAKRPTRVEMAQVIVQALYFRPELPGPKDPKVTAMLRGRRWELLHDLYTQALKCLEQQDDEALRKLGDASCAAPARAMEF